MPQTMPVQTRAQAAAARDMAQATKTLAAQSHELTQKLLAATAGECSICFDTLGCTGSDKGGDGCVCVFRCSHAFCVTCARNALVAARAFKCPLCRTTIGGVGDVQAVFRLEVIIDLTASDSDSDGGDDDMPMTVQMRTSCLGVAQQGVARFGFWDAVIAWHMHEHGELPVVG